MALQGTIDSFPLTDVLTLLATSKKSGRLALDGDRGSAALWITDGEVVGGDMVGGAGATAASLLFEMLRFTDASFAFDAAPAGTEPQHAVEATPLEAAMDQASTLLEEWDDINAVVPSLAHRVALVDELPGESVTLDATSWALVVAATEDPVVAMVGDSLGMDEFGVCAAVASLVERGLATVEEPLATDRFRSAATDLAEDPARAEPDAAEAEPDLAAGRIDGPAIDLADRPDRTAEDEVDATADDDRATAAFPERFPIDDLLGGDATDPDDAWGAAEPASRAGAAFDTPAFDTPAFDSPTFDAPSFNSEAFEGLPPLERVPVSETSTSGPDAWDDLLPDTDDTPEAPVAAADEVDDSTDEVLRQMSKLSPQAAEAIAAALSSVPATAPATPPSAASSAAPSAAPSEGDGDADGDGDGPVTFSGMF